MSLKQPLLSDEVERDIILDLEGLTCSSCTQAVEACLKQFSELENVQVNLFPAPHAKLHLFPNSKLIPERLVQSVEDIGFGCKVREVTTKNGIWQQIKLKMSNHFTNSNNLPNGIRYLSSTDEYSLFEYDSTIFKGIRDVLGMFENAEYVYESHLSSSSGLGEGKKHNETIFWRNRLIIALILTIPIFILSMGPGMSSNMNHHNEEEKTDFLHRIIPKLNFTYLEFILFILTTPVVFISGYPFHKEALISMLKRKKLGMSFLVSLGSLAAYVSSCVILGRNSFLRHSNKETIMIMHDSFESSAVLITFVILGKFLESSAKTRTSNALTHLVALSPVFGILVEENGQKERQIRTELIQKDDILRCASGSKVAADGIVISGSGLLDESAITGESMPVDKTVGDIVVGGSICTGQGGFLMKVTNAGSDTILSQIVQLVDSAQGSKAPIEKIADSISSKFVPFVIFCSVATYLIWTALIQTNTVENHEENVPDTMLPFLFSLSVLVIACPCALGLATPTAVMVGSGVGARNGVLLKSGGTAMEKMANVNCIVFDKTGTLTKGVLKVEDVVPASNAKEILRLAGCAERNSDHPIAQAIVAECQSKGIPTQIPESVNELGGKGIECVLSGDRVRVGNVRFFGENLTQNWKSVALELEKRGCTSILVEVNGQLEGAIGLRDEKKEDATCSIEALKAMGCEIYMITGDNFTTAHVIAAEVGITPDHVMANVLPSEKASAIKILQQNQHRIVAMVGDGINDAPALAIADIGIAIGAGTQIAIETADVVLVNSRLVDVVTALDLSRVVFRRIKLNFVWALIYNSVGLLYACGLFYTTTHMILPAWVAAGAMAFSSVSVVTSSLFLNFYKKPQVKPVFSNNGKIHQVSIKIGNDNEIIRRVDPGCGMLVGGTCNCDAQKCRCDLCLIHNIKQKDVNIV